jgi:membrane protein YqaA with SNARE-associated domain
MLRRLYARIIALAQHRRALAWLGLLSFLESAVLPLAPDILIIPMVLARPRRAWTIAAVATLASVAGGLLGYAIGHFLFHALGGPIIDFYGVRPSFEAFRALYREWGIWLVAAGGFTPLPYKLVAIASGALGLDPFLFILAAFVSRGSRFFLEAALLSRFGQPMGRFIESNLALIGTALLLLLLLGGSLAMRYVF